MALAGITYRRPADTDPKACFCLAIQMDQNHATDEAFHTSHRQSNLPTPSISRIPMASRPTQAAPAARFAHSNPSPGNPVPMDITTWKAKATPNTCQRCGKTGHWVKDCDLCFNVRYMDADELEMELKNKLAAKNVAPAEALEEAEPPVSVEDFVSRSR